MKAIPVEAHPYVLGTAIMAAFFVAALVRVWLLRRQEARLLKNKQQLEKQIATQEREITAIRQDAFAWRSEMQRQFDETRVMMSEQVTLERKRFDDFLEKTRQHEFQLQASLDLTRQMCAELPAAKARVMQLEQALDMDGGEGLLPDHHEITVTPMPDLSGKPTEMPANGTEFEASALPEIPSEGISRTKDLEEKLVRMQQQNLALQQALAASRVRSRLRGRVSARPNPLRDSLK